MPKKYGSLSDASSDEQPDQRQKKAGKLTAKPLRFLSGILRKKRGGKTKYGRIKSGDQRLFAAQDDASDAEEYLTAGGDALSEDELPRTTVLNVAQRNHPAINLSFFHLQNDGGQEELSLQEDEGLLEHEGLDQEEGANPDFPRKVPLTRTSLHTHNHGFYPNPLDRGFMEDLPERLQNAEEYKQSPRGDHFGATHFSPVSFRPTHSFGIINIESLKERFSAIATTKKGDKYQYEVIDPIPSHVHDEPFNPLRAGQRSDPIIGHVVKTGGDNPLIHLRNNSIELPQNNFEKRFKEKYKKFQQEATALLLQQLSIDVTAKDPKIILVAEINQAMISCDKGNLLKKILTDVNGQNPPIKVIFNLPPSSTVDKKTKKLIESHNEKIKALLYSHNPLTTRRRRGH